MSLGGIFGVLGLIWPRPSRSISSSEQGQEVAYRTLVLRDVEPLATDQGTARRGSFGS